MIRLVSGVSGSGKTSMCATLEEDLESNSVARGGILSLAVFEGGYKVAITARNLAAGRTSPASTIARVIPGRQADTFRGNTPLPDYSRYGPDAFSYGKWIFDRIKLGEFDAYASDFIHAYGLAVPSRIISNNAVVIIDEIGPLELDHHCGFIRTLDALDEHARLGQDTSLECIVTARPDIARRLAMRWPGSTQFTDWTPR